MARQGIRRNGFYALQGLFRVIITANRFDLNCDMRRTGNSTP